jgi:hypothetical protein
MTETLTFKRIQAQEYRRRLSQGLGRPIVSFEKEGQRYVQVSDKLSFSASWRTFHDFLFDYVRELFSKEWGNQEITKSDSEAHPLIVWYRKATELQRDASKNSVNGVYMAHQTGAVRAFLGLAYDLYLCAHNSQVQERLLQRLRDKGQFESAAYEAFVIGCFIKAGYSIEFEDETDESRKHCEFNATHSVTGRKFSVEAKAISSTSNRAGASDKPPRFGDRLAGALQKHAEHERIIFLDLSRAENFSDGKPPDWTAKVEQDITTAESWMFDGKPAPPAYLFITNSGFLHALDSTVWSELRIMTGFKIDDFPIGRKPSRIIDFVRAREKHLEIVWLNEALETHKSIPSTFDGSAPEEPYSDELLNRPRIGDAIGLGGSGDNAIVGIFVDAQVDLRTNEVLAQVKTPDGKVHIGTFPLTETEGIVYRREPDTFFDVVKPANKEIKTPLDCFDFLWDTYKNSPKEMLLGFMNSWTGHELRVHMAQKQLAEIYCEAMATQMWQDGQKSKQAL